MKLENIRLDIDKIGICNLILDTKNSEINVFNKSVINDFSKATKFILDNSSNLIKFNESISKNDFPRVFGNGAEKDFIIFFKQLEKNIFPIKMINNYYYFQIGRWDIELLNKKIIKFPSNKIESAIKKSVELLKREDFKDYNIIDLRIHGKIIVE